MTVGHELERARVSASVGPRFADGLAAVPMLGSPVPLAAVSKRNKCQDDSPTKRVRESRI